MVSEPYELEQLIAMLRRSYGAVDGLWFVKCEERLGYAAALELDDEVWQVMPKLQARKARELLGLTGNTLDELGQALGLKFAAEGQQFEVHLTPERLEVRITECPWRDMLAQSGRLHIAGDVARLICTNEARGWAAEFGQEAEFDFAHTKCAGGDCCCFAFVAKRG